MSMRLGLLLLLTVIAAPACSKKEPAEDENTARSGGEGTAAKGDLIETHAHGSIAWTVEPDGRVIARLRDQSDEDVGASTKGSIAWTEGSEDRRARFAWDDSEHALVAKGPAPTAAITEVRYELAPAGEPVTGTLHVPTGGTAALVEGSAGATAAVETGPHGGVIQIVGDDRVEIVADEDSDEVRVYLLDHSGQVVVAGDRTITLAIGGAAPEVIVLVPVEGGAWFHGKWKVVGQPPRLTIVVKRAGKVRVAIVGWHPGVKLVAAGGPKVKVKVKGPKWGPAHAKVDVKSGGGPGMVKIDIKDKGPKGKIKVKFK